jgi:hypothetical protein
MAAFNMAGYPRRRKAQFAPGGYPFPVYEARGNRLKP